jgi:hypothetical protein
VTCDDGNTVIFLIRLKFSSVPDLKAESVSRSLLLRVYLLGHLSASDNCAPLTLADERFFGGPKPVTVASELIARVSKCRGQ